MKKILFYTTFLTQGGGIEVVTVRYINKFIENGYKVDLYIDYDMGEENIREKEIDKRAKITYLKSEKISKLIYKLRTLGKEKKVYNIFLYILILVSDFIVWKKEIKKIERENYDATISFFQFLPSYITKIKGPKHMIFLHGSVKQYFEGIRKHFKNSFFNKINKFDYICTVSEEMRVQLKEIFPNLINNQVTIYNPIDFETIENKAFERENLISDEKKLLNSSYICSVGRLDEGQKDFNTLINAYANLKNESKIDEKLVLVGDGPDKEKLENLVKELKLENNIIFLGKKSNPYIWMKNSEAFILSSKYEGLPTVLIEALILDVPSISSNCLTGPIEILENGKYGELFNIGNTKELEEKILLILQKREKIKTRDYIEKKFGNGFETLEKILESGDKR